MFSILNRKNLELGVVIIAAMAVGKVTLFAIDKAANTFTTWYNKPPKTETTTVKAVS